MITAINSINNNINFRGTTIIKKPFVALDKKMQKAVDESTHGFYDGNINGHTVIIVANEPYIKEEAEFLKKLKEDNCYLQIVNFTKILDWKGTFGKDVNIPEFVKKLSQIDIL